MMLKTSMNSRLAAIQTAKKSIYLFVGFPSPEKDKPTQFDAPDKMVTTRRPQRAEKNKI